MKFKRITRILGPGLITGASDDDPSGIATYSQTGAQFGLNQLWTALYLLPFMIAVQETCARIGAVTGKGLAAVVKTHYSSKILYPIVLLVLVANTINIGADIGAMTASIQLLIPVNFTFITLFITVSILLLEIFTSYTTYARILKWLSLTLLAYPLTLLLINIPFLPVLKATFIPTIKLDPNFLFIIIGVFGTTISPYMFFWQASEEVEERTKDHLSKITPQFLKNLRIDTIIGMTFSNFTTWSIITVAAIVLNGSGITTINTAADAAKALEPLVSTFPNAGFLAKFIFASGVVGLGLLAIPVLSGSASYAVSESLKWKVGLNLKLKQAHGFYGVIIVATIIGLAINYLGINPFKALIFTAVFNGIAAVPLLFLIANIGHRKDIMGVHATSKLYHLLILSTAFGMALSLIGLIITSISS